MGTAQYCVVPLPALSGIRCKRCGRLMCCPDMEPDVIARYWVFRDCLGSLWCDVHDFGGRNQTELATQVRVARTRLDKALAEYGAKPSVIPAIYGDCFFELGLDLGAVTK